MKKLLLFFLSFFIVSQGFAKRISEQEAFDKAQQFMHGKLLKTKPRLVRGSKAKQTFENFYIFNAEAQGGFVIVSGDDRTPCILGYAANGEINTDEIPCNMRWLLDYYDKAISQLPESYAPKTKVASIKDYIPTLISTQWGQGEPYNNLCPQAGGEKCLTGCVATAMAQVINYHRWPQEQTSVVPGYTTSTLSISMPERPAKMFDWNNMSNTAIAQLMLYCGQSIHMDYNTEASGASQAEVPAALVNVFGYSKSANLVGRNNYSDEQWDKMIYEELQQEHPVLYFGYSPDVGGHAFIVDGYADGQYHLNWGWNGYCDGYFTLDRLNPDANMGFNFDQEIVVNACPPADAGDISRPKVIVRNVTCNEHNLERSDAYATFPSFVVTVTLESDLSSDATLQTGLALYSDDGLVKILAQEEHNFTAGGSHVADVNVAIDADVPQGEFRLVAVHRGNDTEEWLADMGSTARYIALTVGEKNMLLQPIPKSDGELDVIEFGVHTIDGITYRLFSQGMNCAEVLLYNETEKYKGDLYIPDYVNYQNMRFDVSQTKDKDSVFIDCPELISLSTSISSVPEIYNCANLKKLELREGVRIVSGIAFCPSLESIVYPASCFQLTFIPRECQNLKSIILKNKYEIFFSFFNYIDSWTKESMPSLKDIYFSGDIPPLYPNYQRDRKLTCNKDIFFHIPVNSKEAFLRSDWKDWNLVEDQPAIPMHVKWDYFGDMGNAAYGGTTVPAKSDINDAELAIRIPTECINAYKNCKLTAIEFIGGADYVFITKRGTDYIVKQTVNPIKMEGQWLRVELSQPYTITGDELFVGIGSKGYVGGTFANYDVVEEDFWYRVMGPDNRYVTPGVWKKNDWQDVSHPLLIRAIIEGENLPIDIIVNAEKIGKNSEDKQNAAKMQKVIANAVDNVPDEKFLYFTTYNDGNRYYVKPVSTAIKSKEKATEKAKQIRLKLRNRSPRIVRQVTFDWNIDGNEQEPITMETGMLPNHGEIVYIDLPDNLAGRNHNVNIKVSDVDGEPDVIQANSSAEFTYSTTGSTFFPRKIVMEEATGTWCGYCPRAIATVENMYKRYPDNFIAIAIHNGDKMSPSGDSYAPFFENISNFPTMCVNRNSREDEPFDIDDIKDKGEAMIKAKAAFVPDNKVEVNTETTFGFNSNETEEYRIAYVVLEDKVGPYHQANYLSDPYAEDDPNSYLNWWIHQGGYVEMLYNDVARVIYDYNGIAGLLPKDIEEGKTYECKYTLALPNNIQNAENLKIITLLIDTVTGEILNADCTAITGNPPMAIRDVNDSRLEIFDIYNLSGMMVRKQTTSTQGLPKGVYIINGRKAIIE